MGHETRFGVPLKGYDENSALTGWRKVDPFKPGDRKDAKNTYNRRVRRRPIEIEEPDDGD